MVEIPRSVLSEHFQERMEGRRLVAAVFLTYQFDPAFFEQEILPVLLDVPLSHAVPIRLVQLEDAIRSLAGQIAVYYDAGGLVQGDGSAKLDVRRIPVRLGRGSFVFHPKNIFLLTEDVEPDASGERPRTLLCASLSANLTRSGWWENVEVCHVEEIAAGERTRLKKPLLWFLDSIRRWAAAEPQHTALREVQGFLRGTEQRSVRSAAGRLYPHLYTGKEPLVDFLEGAAGSSLRGSYLEIISPYFDDATECEPLQRLIERFSPREVRVFLPRGDAGEAMCSQAFFESIQTMRGVCWGRLSGDWLRCGRSEDARARFVHAKVYRFFTQKPKREICFVGSPNLTMAAHRARGNVESGFLLEYEPTRRPEFWLTLEERPVVDYRPPSDGEATSTSVGTRLSLRFRWDRHVAEAFWDGSNESPELRLITRGVALGTIGALPPRVWMPLGAEFADRLEPLLMETSFIDVHGEGEQPGVLLVQEEGMSHKPSLLFQLSAADILRYWSLLTPEQRSAFIEPRVPATGLGDPETDMVILPPVGPEHDTLFDRFAGFFHAFSSLETSLRNALNAKPLRETEAVYRLFGKKYDSLGRLLDRVLDGTDVSDDVNQYVIVVCARQLCQEISRSFPEFWRAHGADVRVLDERLTAGTATIRRHLIARNPEELNAFLDWFDLWFLKRAKPLEPEA